jgi:predicted DNA-binding WGR domain protein
MHWTKDEFRANFDPMVCAADHSLHLKRTDVARNMRRFYEISLQPTLFGGMSLVKNWGRIGSSGQCQILTFEEQNDAVLAFRKLAAGKRKRGYI